MEVNRKALLAVLEAVQPGLNLDGSIEQSDCFVFNDGHVLTFDDELACCMSTEVDFTGAVKAKPLLELLQKLPEEVLLIDAAENELRVKGQKRKAAIKMEAEIKLPLDQIPMPDDLAWRKLPSDFCEAVEVVRQCASKDDSTFALTCIHLAPDFIESCDNYQASRYLIKTGFEQDVLIRNRAALHLANMSATEVAEQEGWVHFRNANGLTLSSRQYKEEYPQLEEVIDINGQRTTLPEGMEAACDLARVFTKDNADNDQIALLVDKNQLTVRGEGVGGWYKESKTIKYSGPELHFRITPAMLKNVLARSRECFVASNRLWIDAGKFVYVAMLFAEEE